MYMSDHTDKPIEYFSLLYLHKGQDDHMPIKEIIVKRHPMLMDMVRTEIASLNEFIAPHTLPPMLRSCEHDPDKSPDYKECPYRFTCRMQSGPRTPRPSPSWIHRSYRPSP